jgi:CdiI N-terminal domain
MAFDIALFSDMVDGSELGNTGQHGHIVIGDETEDFVSLIGFWSPADYRAHWRQAIDRLVNQKSDSCLITSIHDPREVTVISWWLLYPVDGDVALQQALLLLAESKDPFSTADPFASIPRRRIINEDGKRISEWRLPMSDFAEFLRRVSTR